MSIYDDEYWDDEMAEEFHVLERAKDMGIEDTPELRRFIASKDSFGITDRDLEEFADEEDDF